MIIVKSVSKSYKSRFGTRTVLDDISFTINPGEKIGILGRNGSGKSTLIRLLGGAETPTSGKIIRNMSISWPVGLGGGLQGTLSGIDNLKLICRIYGKSIDEKREIIQEVTALGRYLHEPVATYSSGMRANLALAISLVVDFDCYLIDEALSIGDKKFQDQYRDTLQKKRLDKSLVMVSHNERHIRQYCKKICVLHNGKLLEFNNGEEAFNYYENLKKFGPYEIS